LIAYSPDIFASQVVGGISRCIVEIATAARLDGADCVFFAGKTANAYALAAASQPAWSGRMTIEASRSALGRIRGSVLQEGRFAGFARRAGVRIVHRSYYPIRDLLPGSTRVVETLHDMGWERMGHSLSFKERVNSRLKYRALERADAIACVSEFTRSELSETWPELADKAIVIHHGVKRLSEASAAPDLGKSYFVYVGSREFRKNFAILAEALAQSKLAADCLVVCAGGGPFTDEERALFERHGVARSFRQTRADDAALAGLYEGALALLYPSNYEGFGMPLLEAMIHDCPVICSRSSSLPEVGGSAALSVDGADSGQWAHHMVQLASDLAVRERLKKLGRDNVAGFRWDKAGAAYHRLYRQLA
jgi:glycosyltransferase involved in cell wall biosynthesis